MGGRCVRYGWIGGRREKVRGGYSFSSLVKQNKKAKKEQEQLLKGPDRALNSRDIRDPTPKATGQHVLKS